MAKNKIIFISDCLIGPAAKYQGMKNIKLFIDEISNYIDGKIITLSDKYNKKYQNKKIVKIDYLFLKKFYLINLYIFKIFNFVNTIYYAKKNNIKVVCEFISDPLLANKSLFYKLFKIDYLAIFFVENKFFNKRINYVFFKPSLILYSSVNYKIPLNLKKISVIKNLGISIQKSNNHNKFNKYNIIYLGLMTKKKGFDDILYLIERLPNIFEFNLFVNEVRSDNKEFNFYRKKINSLIKKNKKIKLNIKDFNLKDVWKHNGIFIYPTQNYHGTLSEPAILLELLNLKKNIIIKNTSNSIKISNFYTEKNITYISKNDLLKKVLNYKIQNLKYKMIKENENKFLLKNTSREFLNIISEK